MDTKHKIAIVIAGAALIYLLMKSNKVFASPTKSAVVRGCDPLGCGSFGASRSGGSRPHNGIDYKASPGEAIYSPIAGKITRIAYPYANDLSYTGIEIVNTSYKVKMFYLSPTLPVGTQVVAGQRIGTAQNISAKHGSAMVNHIHFEVYDKNGNLLNPTTMMPGVSLNLSLLLKKGLFDSPEVQELQTKLKITADGDFGQLTENALVKAKGVKQITLKDYFQ